MHAQEITFYHAVIIAFLIFGLICGVFVWSIYKQHKRNIALYKAKVAAEITTLEKERQRIANDLHDDLGPILSAIKFNIGEFELTNEDSKLLSDTENYIDDVVQKLRQISNDLMPATLIRKGFTYAVEEFIEKVKGTTPLAITFQYQELPVLTDEININLYRVLLEIIHNALKHAHATMLDITILKHQKEIVIETKDNGQGFNLNHSIRNSPGRGLSNIFNRTELLGGEVYIESEPGKGTSYFITIKYP